MRATKGVSSGKWYWEAKLTGLGDIRATAGIVSEEATDKDKTSMLYVVGSHAVSLYSGYAYAIDKPFIGLY